MSNLSLDLRYQNLTDLTTITFPPNITELMLDYNNLTSLQGVPDTVTTLSVNNNYNLTSLQYVPEGMIELYADNCSITSSTPVPASIELLSLNFNNLDNLTFLQNSTNLMTLFVNNNLINSLLNCPPIVFLYISNNLLTNLQNLPTSIVYLDISNNPVTTLSDFTDNHIVQTLFVGNTQITSLSGVPPTCQFVYNYNSNNPGIYVKPPPQVIEIKQMNNTIKNIPNRPLMFPFNHTGASLTTTGYSRISSLVYPGNNIRVSFITFNLEVTSSGTVTIKIVQISKRSNLGTTLFTTTCDRNTLIYEFALPMIQIIPSKIEIQGRISSKSVNAIMYSCMLY